MANSEITACFEFERLRFDNSRGDVCIAQASCDGDRITLKGPVDDDGPNEGLTYRFYGRWTTYTNRRTGESERQFAYSTFIQTEPASQRGIVSYLQQAPHIGGITATRLFDAYGTEAIQRLKESPKEVAQETPHLGMKAAHDASAWLKTNERKERIHVDLLALLASRGFPRRLPQRLIKEWGNRAADIVRSNPYALMRFRGCGFRLTDALYLSLGLPADSLKRQALCVWYTLSSDTSGHVWRPYSEIHDAITDNIGGTIARVRDAVNLALRAGLIDRRWTVGNDGPLANGEIAFDGDCEWLADAKRAKHEACIARSICDASNEVPQWLGVLA